jgi:hypothetical protein
MHIKNFWKFVKKIDQESRIIIYHSSTYLNLTYLLSQTSIRFAYHFDQ